MKWTGRKQRTGVGPDIHEDALKDLVQGAYAEVRFTRQDAVQSAFAQAPSRKSPTRPPVRVPLRVFGLAAAAAACSLYAVLLLGTPSRPYVQVSRESVIIVGERPFAAVQLERGAYTLKEMSRREQ